VSVTTKQVAITTAADGSFSQVITCPGEILAIGLVIGNLSTPDIAITDTLTGAAIFSKAGIAASARFQPRVLGQTSAGVDIAAAAGPPAIDNVYVPPACFRQLSIAVTGAGDTKSGTLYILVER